MAIKFKEEPLPSVSTFSFDINRWAGVWEIVGTHIFAICHFVIVLTSLYDIYTCPSVYVKTEGRYTW